MVADSTKGWKMTVVLDQVRRLLVYSAAGSSCLVCRRPIRSTEPAMRVQGAHVHRGCATYRVRRGTGRLGYPPR